MPFDKEAMKKKLEKKKELKEKVKKGEITKQQSYSMIMAFNRSQDKYGLCDPDLEETLDSNDID